MVGRLDAKIAIITGASRGIGRATAELFADEGATVVVNFARSEKEAVDVARGINGQHGTRAIAIRADVSNEAQVKEMVRSTVKAFGKVDILVNNAGSARHGDYVAIQDKDMDEMLGTNLKGTLYCSREVALNMVERRSGKIVNIASIAALGTAFSGTTAYAATKAAVVTLTRRLAFELGGGGINVNCVAPGFIRTTMSAAGRVGVDLEKANTLMASKAMLKRIGEPPDVARAVLFLSSDESSFITGQVIVVDGGRMDYLSHSI